MAFYSLLATKDGDHQQCNLCSASLIMKNLPLRPNLVNIFQLFLNTTVILKNRRNKSKICCYSAGNLLVKNTHQKDTVIICINPVYLAALAKEALSRPYVVYATAEKNPCASCQADRQLVFHMPMRNVVEIFIRCSPHLSAGTKPYFFFCQHTIFPPSHIDYGYYIKLLAKKQGARDSSPNHIKRITATFQCTTQDKTQSREALIKSAKTDIERIFSWKNFRKYARTEKKVRCSAKEDLFRSYIDVLSYASF